MENNPSETVDLLERAKAGDPQALNEIFTRHRNRLRRMVEMRLDWRLRLRHNKRMPAACSAATVIDAPLPRPC